MSFFSFASRNLYKILLNPKFINDTRVISPDERLRQVGENRLAARVRVGGYNTACGGKDAYTGMPSAQAPGNPPISF